MKSLVWKDKKVLRKPKKPEKQRTIRQSADCPFSYVDYPEKTMKLDDFLEWCEEAFSDDATNVVISIHQSWDYDECTVSLRLEWDDLIDNPDYEKEMKQYEKKLAKWKEQSK